MVIQPTDATIPFLKWAGGKRWLLRKGVDILPKKYDRYIEPFLGGGAVFFSTINKPFVLADTNAELINCYQSIQSDHLKILDSLKHHERLHDNDHYYQVRKSEPKLNYIRAARFLYLNRTCWNGLYRVNKKGKFNVPKGTKSSIFLETDNFPAVAEKLSRGQLLCQDFEKTIEIAGQGDFIFVDPPYTVKHNFNGFVKYNEKIFSWEDQERLRDVLLDAVNRGAMVTITNADHESIRELYQGIGSHQSLNRASVISGNPTHRSKTSELLIKIGW